MQPIAPIVPIRDPLEHKPRTRQAEPRKGGKPYAPMTTGAAQYECIAKDSYSSFHATA